MALAICDAGTRSHLSPSEGRGPSSGEFNNSIVHRKPLPVPRPVLAMGAVSNMEGFSRSPDYLGNVKACIMSKIAGISLATRAGRPSSVVIAVQV
ncbi:MAG: hypothetical protein JSV48_04820 [Bradyrhizobium sp.]|nr:MAG: hypothetical protein JSV48_04820 [Bradyrhizobium sp.]